MVFLALRKILRFRAPFSLLCLGGCVNHLARKRGSCTALVADRSDWEHPTCSGGWLQAEGKSREGPAPPAFCSPQVNRGKKEPRKCLP